jgi:hypothetical protein
MALSVTGYEQPRHCKNWSETEEDPSGLHPQRDWTVLSILWPSSLKPPTANEDEEALDTQRSMMRATVVPRGFLCCTKLRSLKSKPLTDIDVIDTTSL